MTLMPDEFRMSAPAAKPDVLQFRITPLAEEGMRGCTAVARAALGTGHANAIAMAIFLTVAALAFVVTPATPARTTLIAVWAVIGTLYALQMDSRARLRRVQSRDPHALEEYSVEIGPDVVRTWCAHIDARYPWREFTQVSENAEFYLFVRPSGSGIAFPKRVLATSCCGRESVSGRRIAARVWRARFARARRNRAARVRHSMPSAGCGHRDPELPDLKARAQIKSVGPRLWILTRIGVWCVSSCFPLACLATSSVATPPGQWALVATRSNTFTLQINGPATSVRSVVRLHSDDAPAGIFGQAQYVQPLVEGHERRVRVVADIRPESIRVSATLWVRADRNGRPIVSEYAAIPVRGSSDWQQHSSFYTLGDMRAFRSTANTPVVDVHLEEGDIGYVYLSGYLAENIDSARAYDDRMHAAIDRIAPSARCGWVIDLRGNSGGVPEPMMVAVEPFVSPDSLRTDERAAFDAWFGPRARMDRPALERTHVALLLGSQTGSAGERTTLFLQRRAHTRTFGSPTAGATTRREMFMLPDGAAFAITTEPMRPGTTREAAGRIVPDEIVPSGGPAGDQVLRASTRWLREDCM